MDPKCNRKAPLWKLMTLSYTNFHDSFIETDSIGCGTQLNRKVPPDENNFSWARLSLLRRLRPVKQTRATEFPLSFPTHAFRFDLKYSINSLLEPATRTFILRRTYSNFWARMSINRGITFSEIRIWFIIWGQAQE